MKPQLLLGVLSAGLGMGVARGTLNTEAFTGLNVAIPEGNPVGVSLAETVGDLPGGSAVAGLTVSLDVSGGYNGSLYAYLVAPNGALVTLLNRPGVTGGNPVGYGGSGFNITLSDAASGSIQTTPETIGSVFSGNYQAAGTLANFNGSAADGTWTLFFTDESVGGGQATLTGWSLEITAVPEPVNVAMAIFGAGLIGVGATRCYRGSKKTILESGQAIA